MAFQELPNAAYGGRDNFAHASQSFPLQNDTKKPPRLRGRRIMVENRPHLYSSSLNVEVEINLMLWPTISRWIESETLAAHVPSAGFFTSHA